MCCPSLFGIVGDLHAALAVVGDPRRAVEEIAGDDRAADLSRSSICGLSWRNSQPRTSIVPPAAWIAWRPSFWLSHWVNVQSLKPTVPLPAMRAIWWHGPQNAQLTKRTLPRFVSVNFDHRRVGAVEGDELAVGDQQADTGRSARPPPPSSNRRRRSRGSCRCRPRPWSAMNL